ncbi:dihydroxyacetone kinase family protein [Frigoribacterium sp. CFBP 13729]|uniref:dihydroxyacetone kinase family protein n=1 Tax=unclassified Frigoribacterium TaxID=2627005 RepID=UPI00178606B6|nr:MULTISPECIES: dihydroxyacetone kinase family protein [unclassified Frigoribacterium]MBD8585456.1 dihydroxyacetone kinase family protein [Frigoribacterium sp. CFBP 8766]MBD8610081.1 dihydroxyacetone kinase family protein [Frigoribacterium sp. CFBP 13729]
MTILEYDATTFADEALDGFTAAHGSLRRVDGGVVRRDRLADGQVAVVVGGGSGHYPAFAGLVGPGLAAGVAYGNIFASPSAGQVCRVSRAVQRGGGVVLSFGNYAGDVLNFGQAAERLRAEGVDVRVVAVTDDIASGGRDEIAKRRGIAGDLTVFKVLGAAAEAGHDLDRVEQLGRRANDRTRSFGVAFSGCTLPGAREPLFTVPEGRMSIGLGIHGEPGVGEADLPSARELAELLVGSLLAEAPEDAGDRVVVLLNGLGTYKYEELFVLYGHVARLLDEAGVTIVQPEVGELVTSLDMSGVSATFFWVDAELEQLWGSPASSPAFRKGAVETHDDRTGDDREPDEVPAVLPVDDLRHARVGGPLLAGLERVAEMVVASEDEFGRLDAVAGDGDHGIGMARGITAALASARAAVERGAGVSTVLAEAGEGWAEHAGGTSGALWGVCLTSAGAALAAEPDLRDPRASARAAAAGLAAIQRLGGAEVGDKTLVDAFVPLVDALHRAAADGLDLPDAWARAAEAADEAADATAHLRPRLGRARPLAEKSVGHPDAGAVSFSRIAGVVARETVIPTAAPDAPVPTPTPTPIPTPIPTSQEA